MYPSHGDEVTIARQVVFLDVRHVRGVLVLPSWKISFNQGLWKWLRAKGKWSFKVVHPNGSELVGGFSCYDAK